MKQILFDGRITIRTIQIYIFYLRKTKQAPITDACVWCPIRIRYSSYIVGYANIPFISFSYKTIKINLSFQRCLKVKM